MRTVGFRHDQAGGLRGNHRLQARDEIRRTDGIDADPDRLAVLILQEVAREGACLRTVLCRDGVFEVEDQRIRGRRFRLGELLLAVSGDEEERTQDHFGVLCIRALRLHWATVSPRWLMALCSNRTMPWDGRDLLSRISSTVVSTRSVSPWKTGLGKVTSVMPRLATVDPSVVTCTEMPIIRPSVNSELTMR